MKLSEEPHKKITHSSAKDFLASLQRSDSGRVDPARSRLFRGESDISRELKPAAFRSTVKERLVEFGQIDSPQAKADLALPLMQQLHERKAVELFYRFANEQSLPLPDLSASLHARFLAGGVDREYSQEELERWPEEELLPLIAMAQHYGFPTRLLDWSRDPLVAAYFAAANGVRVLQAQNNNSERGAAEMITREIGVWASNAHLLRLTSKLRIKSQILVVDSPYAGNPNMAAQKGCHSLVMGEHFNEPLDIALREIWRHSDPNCIERSMYAGETADAFVKHALPIGEAPDLLNLLLEAGYNAGRIYPGYSSCKLIVDEILTLDRMRATRKPSDSESQ